MDFTAATEKIQRFFGLEGAEDEVPTKDERTAYQTPSEPEKNAPRPKLRPQTQNQTRNQEPSQNDSQRTMSRDYTTQRTQASKNERVQPQTKQDNVLNMSHSTQSTARPTMKDDSQVKKVLILEPRTYTEAKTIAKAIFRSEVVIINFRVMEEAQARRIVDFLTGVVYALDGDIQRLGDELFICTPPNMEIDSDVAKSLLKTQFTEF